MDLTHSRVRKAISTAVAVGIIVVLIVVVFGGYLYYASTTTTTTTTTTSTQAVAATINIGVIIPLSGSSASSGQDEKNAYTLAEQTINNNGGIKSLGGAKVNLIFMDSAGDPTTGANDATQLITQDHVVALLGCYQSSVTAAVAAVAERQGIPMVNPDSTDHTLIQHGYQWFFRTTADDVVFTNQFFQFMNYLQNKTGVSLKNVAIVHENSAFGTGVGKLEVNESAQYGYNVVADISYSSSASDVSSEVLQLVQAKPDAVLMAGYTDDSILFVNTFKQYSFTPKIIIGDDAGFVDSAFPKTLGPLANNLFSRDVFSPDLGSKYPGIGALATAFQNAYGYSLGGNAARAYVGVLVLADALNRAASTTPTAIRTALLSTDLTTTQIPMPWQGVKFDPTTHQNTLAGGVIIQWQNDTERTVWPLSFATTQYVFPFPGWSS